MFTGIIKTVGAVAANGLTPGFDVALIPHALSETTLGELRPDDRVNLEADVLGKYVKRYLERILPGANDAS